MFILDTLTVDLLPSYVIGDDVSIVCTVSLISADVSSLVMNWFKDDEMIKTDNIITNGSSSTFKTILMVTKVSSANAGVYTCKTSINGSNIGLTDSKPLCLRGTHSCYKYAIHLWFIDLVPFNEDNDNFTDLPLGYSAIVQCVNFSSINETSLRSIEWIDSSGDIISDNNTLILPNVLPSLNNTEYTCTAEVDTNPVICLPDNKNITIYTKSM